MTKIVQVIDALVKCCEAIFISLSIIATTTILITDLLESLILYCYNRRIAGEVYRAHNVVINSAQ